MEIILLQKLNINYMAVACCQRSVLIHLDGEQADFSVTAYQFISCPNKNIFIQNLSKEKYDHL